MRSDVLVSVGLMALAASGCQRQAATERSTVRDSAGIHIVVFHSLPDSPSIHLNDVPVLSLGVENGSPAETFDNIRGLVRLPDGTMFVGDGGSGEIRSFSATGKHLATFGGTGNGPAEFRGMGSIVALTGDSVAGVDAYTGKVAVFDRDGRFGRSFKLPTLPGGYSSPPWVRGSTSDGRLLLESWRIRSPDFDRTAPGYERVPAALTLFSCSTLAETLIGTLPGNEVPVHTRPVSLGVALALRSLLGPPGAWLPMEGSMVSAARRGVVAAGTTDLSEIRVFHGTVLVRILRFAMKKRPVGGSVRDRIRTKRLNDLSPHARSSEWRDTIENDVKALPDSMPIFGMIHVDAAGRVWVPRYEPEYEAGPSLWWIFGKSGLLVGSIALPADFTPYQIDDSMIVGVQQDSMWVQRVREYAFGSRS